ncbi:MAG: hypothetical protein EXQ76_04185 [Candidatus Planktophila sp.]|nr:hypothetical protein [Candidatus Planktophila sp.]
MSKESISPKDDESDEEELIRSKFDSIVSGLSLDESAPSTYLDELERIDRADRFVEPNPPTQTPRSFFLSAKRAVLGWLKRPFHDDDGVHL